MSEGASSAEVLLVEDDPEIRASLRELLGEEGFALYETANGLEAIEYLRSGNRPRVIILDLAMPVVNGWEFRIAQKANPSISEIPVVIISAREQTSDDVAWMEAAEFLPKPIDVERLLGAVRRFCA